MQTSQNGINLIKKFEGCRLEAYLCPAGKWTIGYGYTVDVKKGDNITKEKAEQLLAEYIKKADKVLSQLIKVKVSQNQYDAVMSLFYNIGYSALKDSTLLKKINSGNFNAAALEFLKWNKITQNGKIVVCDGLTNRRKIERALFVS